MYDAGSIPADSTIWHSVGAMHNEVGLIAYFVFVVNGTGRMILRYHPSLFYLFLTMDFFFINLLFGHFVGDFFLQPRKMAIEKGNNPFWCILHCFIYSCAVVLFTHKNVTHLLDWSLFVFLSHYPIDRWSLADKWLRLIHGRSIKTFLSSPQSINLNLKVLDGGFTSIVYVVVDNVLHLALMYYGCKFLIT